MPIPTGRRAHSRLVLGWALLLGLLGAGGGHTARAAEGPDRADTAAARGTRQANQFLDRLIGHWIGEGDFQGTVIRDTFVADRVLDGTWVVIQTREIDGADFESDMYVGYDASERRYELYFFSDFTGFGPGLPVRVMAGRRDGQKLIFEERRSLPQPRRFTFELLGEDAFRLTKTIYLPSEQLLSVEEFEREMPEFR